jgi:hypothetical protein
LNGDLASGPPRLLVTEITSDRNLVNHKTLKNSQTVADRRVLHGDYEKPFRICVSDGHVTRYVAQTSADFRFPSVFFNMKMH